MTVRPVGCHGCHGCVTADRVLSVTPYSGGSRSVSGDLVSIWDRTPGGVTGVTGDSRPIAYAGARAHTPAFTIGTQTAVTPVTPQNSDTAPGGLTHLRRSNRVSRQRDPPAVTPVTPPVSGRWSS